MTANADMTPTVGEGRHLPECDTPHNGLLPCICESLRACEKRVLDAARAAVQCVGIQPEPVQQYTKSLAAIDSLRATNT